ncbi:MAG: uracil-DNA glycosylase [Nitrospirae bacterium]|nr:uracil-DNA glycosylase [Nitrospirota bacterium]MBI3595455.1 uracil-DNA glycosylase [Nitrospirota bacterium]
MSRKKLEKELLSIVQSVEDHLQEARMTGIIEVQLKQKEASPVKSCQTLEEIQTWMGDCQRCKLNTTRNHIVFGTGNSHPDLVFVGEGPGADEDDQGKPFVGRAGQLLTKMIEAMGIKREEVYITNVVKCRPPANRNPEPEEIRACSPFLENQLKVLKPRVICTLGTFASQTLLKTDEKISRLRGRFHPYEGMLLMPTYHPAYLLRNPSEKKSSWEDIQIIMKELNLKPL